VKIERKFSSEMKLDLEAPEFSESGQHRVVDVDYATPSTYDLLDEETLIKETRVL
jgi:hypothetical protein